MSKLDLGLHARIQNAAAYEAVASEYYDLNLHPTCAAFDSASFSLLKNYISRLALKGAVICDVGAGASQVAKLLGNQIPELDSLWLVDASQKMLRWSDKFKFPNIRRRIDAAENLHKIGLDFDFIVASLGDPYNYGPFWHSVERSLKTNGVCLFTTPSHEWATSYRSNEHFEATDKALFELSDGSKHYVPSLIYPPSHQSQLLHDYSLAIRSTKHATINNLELVPPKLSHLDRRTSVVTLYEIAKSG